MAKKKQDATTPTGKPGRANEFESFDDITIHRSELKNAPYNPRVISDKNRLKLSRNMKKVGLLGPVAIWNRRTGNIVGGHQRVSILDSLNGTKDYMVRVSAVDLDEKTEKEQNIFLNNPETQGEFDYEQLSTLFFDEGVGFEESGFDSGKIEDMFGTRSLLVRADADALEKMAERIRESQAIFDSSTMSKQEGDGDLDNTDFYAVAVFQSEADRDMFLNAIGFSGEMYVDGNALRQAVLDKEPEAFTPFLDGNFVSKAHAYFMNAMPRHRIKTAEDAKKFFEEKFSFIRNLFYRSIDGEEIPEDEEDEVNEDAEAEQEEEESVPAKKKGTDKKARR